MAAQLDNYGSIPVTHPGGSSNVLISVNFGTLDLDDVTNVCAAALDALTGYSIGSVTVTESIERPVDS